jgi:hypothetical protein
MSGQRSGDEGSVTLFACIASVGLLAMLGLVVDGGVKVRALQQADRIAAEAARSGGQAIDVRAALDGSEPVLDATAARKAAQTFLKSAGVTGTVTVGDGGRALTVEVTSVNPTVFLGLVGVDSLTVRGTATVSLVRGVTGAGR